MDQGGRTMKQLNVMKHYKLWFVLSGTVILLGLIMMLYNGFTGGWSNALNLGIDFTGGTMMQIDMGKTVPVKEISDALEEFNLNPEIVHAGQEKHEVIIKTKSSLDSNERDAIYAKMKTTFGLEKIEENVEQFGPSVGAEIRNKAMIGIAIASVAMLIYISIRFETVFGVAAIVALLHDVFFLISIYSIFRLNVSSSFIAAILTIVGYSINDTIVVFDRVRENVKREKTKDHFDLINTSVTQTLSRTLNTSLTTLVVIGALYVFGVSTIKEFALPLFVGIAVGTYSSIFIASPVWALARNYIGSKSGYGNK